MGPECPLAPDRLLEVEGQGLGLGLAPLQGLWVVLGGQGSSLYSEVRGRGLRAEVASGPCLSHVATEKPAFRPLPSHPEQGPCQPSEKGTQEPGATADPASRGPPGRGLPTYRRKLLPLLWPQGSPQLWGPELEGERQDQGSRNF